MDDALDNPVWYALLTGNSNLANGNSNVKYFDKEVSPFAAMKENSVNNFGLLYELVPHTGTIGLMTPVKIAVPHQWGVAHCIEGLQMIYSSGLLDNPDLPVTSLKTEHVPQMLALTKLTQPGPFGLRTIEFGHYEGVFFDNRLVAMAGQRLHVGRYAEISAVCTHPDHRGKGYARLLMARQINRIIATGDTPFLHVRNGNDSAIRVYEDLGFTRRSDMNFYFISKR